MVPSHPHRSRHRARPNDPHLERLWHPRLRQQSASGLSGTALCSREGITVARCYSWKRRLAAVASPCQPALFVLVRGPDGPHELRSLVARGVEFELPQQVRLRLESPPEPEWLGRVVEGSASPRGSCLAITLADRARRKRRRNG